MLSRIQGGAEGFWVLLTPGSGKLGWGWHCEWLWYGADVPRWHPWVTAMCLSLAGYCITSAQLQRWSSSSLI